MSGFPSLIGGFTQGVGVGPYGWGWRHHYHYDHVSLNHVNIYHHWDHGVVHSEHNYGFNAWNGREWSSHWGARFNPYSGRSIQRAEPLILHGDNSSLHPAISSHTPAHNLPEGSAPRFSAYDGNFHARVPSAPAVRLAPSAPVTTLAPGLTYHPNLYGSRETAASIVKVPPLAGSVTPVRLGRPYPITRRLRWSNTRSTTAWPNSALITSAHLAGGSRIPPAALPIQAAATDKN